MPIVRADTLDKDQVRKLRILDNKLNESEWHLWNLKLELDALWELDIGDLNIDIKDLFPEFNAPEFNPDEYDDSQSDGDDKKVCVKVFVDNKSDAALLVQDLEWLGYKNVKF